MPVSRLRRSVPCRLLLAAVAVALLASGCELRRETPPPTPRSPDAIEKVRQSAAIDARDLVALARAAAGSAAGDLRPGLSRVSTHAAAQLKQLGGVHVDPYATASAGTTAVATTAPQAQATTPDALVQRLKDSYRTLRKAADGASGGALARLLASISADRLVQAQQVASAVSGKVPAQATTDVPSALPSGLAASAAVDLVTAEDQAGYAFEVTAALRSGSARDAARARAVVHRQRAQAWAEAAQVAGSSQDPRRVAYAIDRTAAATHLPADVETALAARYAELVATLGPSVRTVLIDALTDSAVAARTWGAPETAFPGLPERPADKS